VLNEVDRQLVFICRDGGLRIHDLNAPAAAAKTASHGKGGAIWSGAFSHDGKTFVAGHDNGDVVVWDVKTWKARRTVSLGAKWPVRELAVAPDGSAFVAEGKAELELWSLSGERPKKVAAVGPRYNFGEGLAFSPKGDLVATGGMFDLVLHNATTGEKTKAMRHASYTMGLQFSPDGKRIASAPRGNVNKFLAVFDVADGKLLFNAGPFGHYVAGVAFTPDGKRVVATGPQKDVRLFDAGTGTVVLTLKRTDHTAVPAVSRDGRLLGWSEPSGYRFIDLGKKPAGGK
jgi:WD40 repeat protein